MDVFSHRRLCLPVPVAIYMSDIILFAANVGRQLILLEYSRTDLKYTRVNILANLDS